MFITQQNLEQRSQHQCDQTAAELEVDSMLKNSPGKDDQVQNTLHSRLIHFQQQKFNNFDTYPPKRNFSKKLQHHQSKYNQVQQQNNSLSSSNILQATTQKQAMSSRNSPLKSTNTGRFYTKRLVKRSFSESSPEKLQRYTTSDSSTSQEEDELMMSTSDKRKMIRRSLSSGLQHHKYKHHQMSHRSQRTSQCLDGDDDDGGSVVGYSALFGTHSHYVSDMIDIGIRVVLVVVFR